jgi:hypothetical protein
MSNSQPRPPRKRRPRIGPYDQRPRIMHHVNRLPAEAPLRVVVADPGLDDRLKLYEDADADANSAQKWFKRWAGLALALMTVATLISSLMLFPIEKMWPESLRWRGFVSGMQSAANAIALIVVWWLNRSEGVARWIDLRAEAERLRSEYFRALLAAPATGATAPELLSQKLALIEFAHHDYQRGYLASAISKHADGASRRARPRRLSTAATLVAILIGLLAAWAAIRSQDAVLQAILALIDDPIRWQLGLNTMASALLAFASARSMIHQDDRNAALYRGTLADLDRVRGEQRQVVIAAAERGDEAMVAGYAREVQAILDADSRAWRLAREAVDPNAPPPPKWKVW